MRGEYKPNLSTMRAIKASDERGVSVTPQGIMRAISPQIPVLRAPRVIGPPRLKKRKNYVEI